MRKRSGNEAGNERPLLYRARSWNGRFELWVGPVRSTEDEAQDDAARWKAIPTKRPRQRRFGWVEAGRLVMTS